MRILHSITWAALMAAFLIGCSKSSVSEPQATTPPNAAEAPAFMTNSLSVLQARYGENQAKLSESLSRLRELRGSTSASQQQFQDLQTNIEQLIEMQKSLTNAIEAKKLDTQVQAQVTR